MDRKPGLVKYWPHCRVKLFQRRSELTNLFEATPMPGSDASTRNHKPLGFGVITGAIPARFPRCNHSARPRKARNTGDALSHYQTALSTVRTTLRHGMEERRAVHNRRQDRAPHSLRHKRWSMDANFPVPASANPGASRREKITGRDRRRSRGSTTAGSCPPAQVLCPKGYLSPR